MIKVAFVSPINLERDGIAILARELVGHLSKRCDLVHFPLDHEVHDRLHFRKMADAINRCDLLHIEHTHGFFKRPLYPFRDGYRDLLGRVKVPRLVVYHEPVEKVKVHFPYGADTLASRAKRTLLYGAMVAARPFADAFWLPRYNREIFSVPERVVVHTEYRAAMVRRFAPGARISVIPLPVYGARERGPDALPLPFGEDDVVLTIFGFIDLRKDYIGVLQALLELPPRFKLLVAGGCFNENECTAPGSPYRRMTDFIRGHGLGDRVHVTGFCPDSAIPDIMRATDIVIAPFKEHHSSGSINMAIAYSRPIVAYRTLLTEEMNRNGAGLVIVDGKGGLPRAVSAVETDPGTFAEAVRQEADYRSRFGFAAQAERFVQWYAELLAGRAS